MKQGVGPVDAQHQQWIELEDRASEVAELSFRRGIGLDVDPATIERGAKELNLLAERMASSHRDDPDAWGRLGRIIWTTRLTPLVLELRKLHETHFAFGDILLEGKPVTPYSRRKYLRLEDDPQKRHELLSRLARGHPAVDEAGARYRATQSELSEEWGYSPLDDFLLAEGLNVDQLRSLLCQMGEAMRPAFEECFAQNRAEVLGSRQGEPWEDLATLYGNRWSAHVDRQVPLIDGVAAARRVAGTMGFAVDRIAVDLEERPRKQLGARIWAVRIPQDVRISVRPRGLMVDLHSLYHEMGHALHFTHIDADLPYCIRTGLSHGVAETFSFWLNSLLSDSHYLQSELGLSGHAATEVIRFEQLARATLATFMCAQASCVVDYWMEGPLTFDQLGERLARYMKQFMGLTCPVGSVRIIASFVPVLGINALGYPVGYARLGHLLGRLEALKRDWWNAPTAGEEVRRYMRGGRKAGFPASMLDVGPFTARFGTR
jgi:hypothetical protein